MTWIVSLLVHVAVFGVAIAFVTRRNTGVRVQPRSALPVVALVFALLNAFLYGAIATFTKVVSLWTLTLVAPFIANAALLWLTDKLIKPFKVEGLWPLAYASFVVTLFHFGLRLLHL